MAHVKFLTSGALLFFCTGIFAQTCLPQGIQFYVQQQIDSFPLNYPNCTEIEGDVTIYGSGINSLAPLQQITRIDGKLRIHENDILQNLNGLHNLTSVGESLVISNNYSITNLSGLESLEEVAGLLSISNNLSLINLEGLSSITELHIVNIFSNPALQNLSGLFNLKTTGDFYISGNNITSFLGLDSLKFVWGDLNINNNTEILDFSGLEGLEKIGGSLMVVANNKMVTLEGLHTLESIGGAFWIQENIELLHFDDISSLKSLGSLYVKNNPNLTSISMPNQLVTLGHLVLEGNMELSDLSGMSSVTEVNGNIIISFNQNLESLNGLDNLDPGKIENLELIGSDHLSFCAVKSICDYLGLGNEASVFANDQGCNTVEEISYACYVLDVENIGNSEIVLYPNPAMDDINIISSDSQPFHIDIFNCYGRHVYRELNASSGLDISFLSNGLYYVKITKPNQTVLKTLVKL